jgi:cell division septation protein DedD
MTVLDKAAAARRSVMRGDPTVVLICSASAEVLSNRSREFVRTLRSDGARVEFHTPGHADALLQSTNRLLESIPLEAILSSTELFPPHLLIIDDAETLSGAEATALRRLVQGLRGSAFRVLLLAKRSRSEVDRLPLADLIDLMVIWDADKPESEPIAAKRAPNEPPKVEPVKVEPIKVEPPKAESTQAEPAKKTSKSTAKSSTDEVAAPIPDVLADLARERAETRGFDVTFSRRWMSTPLKVAAAVIVVLLLGYGLTSGLMISKDSEPLVYDCGSHPDRESIDVLLARIGRSTPTRVTAESGRFRLQLGPFPSKSAAEAVREQAWLLGSCRVNPIALSAMESLARKAGG